MINCKPGVIGQDVCPHKDATGHEWGVDSYGGEWCFDCVASQLKAAEAEIERMRLVVTHKNRGLLFCDWEQSDKGDRTFYETSCGESHEFVGGGPCENHYEFCPYCGCVMYDANSEQCDYRKRPSAQKRFRMADTHEEIRKLKAQIDMLTKVSLSAGVMQFIIDDIKSNGLKGGDND